MICGDPSIFIELKRQELLADAERERLAARVHHDRSALRARVAVACYRLADWLDDPRRYLQQSESGRISWARVR